jgi:hypothetical protein
VSWNDAVAFCAWLSKKEGKEYRLPTEAQWEYSCRAGSRTKFSFGNDDQQMPDYGWFAINANNQVQPVGQKKPNAWGLYDMHGNVFEWTADYYAEDYYQNSPKVDPAGPATGGARILRGGAWYYGVIDGRSAYRRRVHGPDHRHPTIGFRVALTAPTGTAAPAPKTDDWLVLFRSANPAHWNQDIKTATDFAVPIDRAPGNIRYLRLSRGNDLVIIPMTKQRLGQHSAENGFGFVSGLVAFDTVHLGVYSLDMPADAKGTIVIRPSSRGWGFGHVHTDNHQGYSWNGQPVAAGVFEIAVKATELTDGEARNLLAK